MDFHASMNAPLQQQPFGSLPSIDMDLDGRLPADCKPPQAFAGNSVSAPPPRATRTSGRIQNAASAASRTQPAFLRKTMDMIDQAPPALAGWAPDGRSFVIRDPQQLAATVIPQHFNHRKFSSFVRQLNFYGFRKLKADEDPSRQGHWEFHHESFVRGRPDLLDSIKRRTYASDGPSSAEVDKLRAEVSTLQSSLSEMREGMRRLTELVQHKYPGLGQPQQAPPPSQEHLPPAGASAPGFAPRAHAQSPLAHKKRKAPEAVSFPMHPNPKTAAAALDEEEDLRELLESLDFADDELMPPLLVSQKSMDALSKPARAWSDAPSWEKKEAPAPAAAPAAAAAAVADVNAMPDAAIQALVQRLLPHVVATLATASAASVPAVSQQQLQQQQLMAAITTLLAQAALPAATASSAPASSVSSVVMCP